MDQTDIRRSLKDSLEVLHYKHSFLQMAAVDAFAWLIFTLGIGDDTKELIIETAFLGILLLLVGAYYLIRLARIFRKIDGYVFCQCLLDHPHSLGRYSFYFTVDVQDSADRKFPVQTRAIFQTRGFVQPIMEHYVNATVTIAYNEETGQVVVIG